MLGLRGRGFGEEGEDALAGVETEGSGEVRGVGRVGAGGGGGGGGGGGDEEGAGVVA